MQQLLKLFGASSPLDCKLAWYKMMKNIGLETNMSKLGICSSDDVDLILNNVNLERLNNNPVVVSEETLKNILKSLF
jgi:alcohol dehydrogenase class IV